MLLLQTLTFVCRAGRRGSGHFPATILSFVSKSTKPRGAAPQLRPIQRLLAANRSEIAIRIFRAANELNLRTIGIYSREDRLSLHRFKADEAYEVGVGKGPVEAYLDIDEIVALAQDKK